MKLLKDPVSRRWNKSHETWVRLGKIQDIHIHSQLATVIDIFNNTSSSPFQAARTSWSACLMWSSPTWWRHASHSFASAVYRSNAVAAPWWRPVFDAVVSQQIPMMTSSGIFHSSRVACRALDIVIPLPSAMRGAARNCSFRSKPGKLPTTARRSSNSWWRSYLITLPSQCSTIWSGIFCLNSERISVAFSRTLAFLWRWEVLIDREMSFIEPPPILTKLAVMAVVCGWDRFSRVASDEDWRRRFFRGTTKWIVSLFWCWLFFSSGW